MANRSGHQGLASRCFRSIASAVTSAEMLASVASSATGEPPVPGEADRRTASRRSRRSVSASPAEFGARSSPMLLYPSALDQKATADNHDHPDQ